LKLPQENLCLSQAAAGVSLRSIQMHEQRRKDVSKAQAKLARALGCGAEELLERETDRLSL
jgi:hypothetical protein